MRLGIDASNLRSGGGLTHLVELLRSAEPAAHGIASITLWGAREMLARLPSDRPWLTSRHEPMLDGPLPARFYWQRVRLARLARSCCDVLFVPGGGDGGGFEPFVTMSRNLLPFEPTEACRYGVSWARARVSLIRVRQTVAFRRARGVIFLNDYARATVMRSVRCLAGATAVVPHGIAAQFRRAPRPPRPITACSEADPLRLLYVSTVDVYKHQWRVVEAVATLRRRGLPVDLTLVGAAYAPSLRRLQAAMRRHDPGGVFVHYRGEVSSAELADVYHHAEIFVFASSCENMPNILLEAMAAGLPIACAARGPMPDILADGGAYFDPEDAGAISDALLQLVRDPSLRARLASIGHERARPYTWERCAAETLAFLVKSTTDTPAVAGSGTIRHRASAAPAATGGSV